MEREEEEGPREATASAKGRQGLGERAGGAAPSSWHTDQGWGKAWKPPLPTLHGADEGTFSNSLWPLKGLGSRHGPSFTLEATLRTHPGMTKKVADSVQLQSLKLPEPAILAL